MFNFVGELTGLTARVHDEGTNDAPTKPAGFMDELCKFMGEADVSQQHDSNPHPHDDSAIQEANSSMFNMAAVREYVGSDVLSLLSVPVFIMEPLTMLQKMGEVLEYTEFLDAADKAEDPVERMVQVAAFLMSPFGACERAWKPFNPLLGETFELEGLGPEKDGRFFAEQVTLSPPVGVAHAENPKWEYDIVSAPKTRFLGNSLEVFPIGRTRIKLRSSGETYTHVPPHVKVHSIVLGRTWIDVEGDFYVFCPESGARCDVSFTPCGWFNQGRYEFSGHVMDKDGVKRVRLSGLWSSHLDAVECDAEGAPLEGATSRRIWTCKPKPEGDYYGMTQFARQLNTCKHLRAPPLPSDSRRRADREALVGRHLPKAAAEKSRLEEAQRLELVHREKGQGSAWESRWFEPVAEGELLPGEMDAESVPLWRWKAGGFERLDKLIGVAEGGQQQQQQVQELQVADAVVCGHGFAPWQFPDLHQDQVLN